MTGLDEEFVFYSEWDEKLLEDGEHEINFCKTMETLHIVSTQKTLAFMFTFLDSKGNLHTAL